jgi:hypothetical protein
MRECRHIRTFLKAIYKYPYKEIAIIKRHAGFHEYFVADKKHKLSEHIVKYVVLRKDGYMDKEWTFYSRKQLKKFLWNMHPNYWQELYIRMYLEY